MTDKTNAAQRLAEINEGLESDITQLQDDNKALASVNESYTELGSVEEIKESLERVVALDRTVLEQGSKLDALNEALAELAEEGAEDVVESIKAKLDSAKELSESVAQFTEEHGTFEQVAEALGAAEVKLSAISEAFGIANIDEAAKLAKFCNEYGTIEEAAASIDRASEVLAEIAEAKRTEELTAVAEKYGKTLEDVKPIMEKFSITDATGLSEAFALMGVKEVSESKGDEEVSESITHKKPGSAFNNIITGKAFKDAAEDIDESINESNRQKAHDDVTIDKAKNSAERMKRIL